MDELFLLLALAGVFTIITGGKIRVFSKYQFSGKMAQLLGVVMLIPAILLIKEMDIFLALFGVILIVYGNLIVAGKKFKSSSLSGKAVRLFGAAMLMPVILLNIFRNVVWIEFVVYGLLIVSSVIIVLTTKTEIRQGQEEQKEEQKLIKRSQKTKNGWGQGIKNGWDLVKESIKVFSHHPKFVVPLLIVWLIWAPIVIYGKYWFDVDAYVDTHTTSQVFLLILAVIFLFTFLLAFSCSILLEIIQQLESGQKLSIAKSFWSTLSRNTIKILPIVIVWTIISFILLMIQVLLSKDKGRKKELFSAENAAKTLAGYRNFSFSEAFFKALEKCIRMVVFLILPAIAWENLGFWKATKRGLAIFRAHLSAFVTGFVLTEFAAAIIFLPPAILFYISGKFEITFPVWVWVTTIIYIAFAWSYSVYLEQMFTALLYLWHYKWEKEVAKAQQENRPIPSLRSIPKPSILDEVPELIEKAEIPT